MESKTEDSWCCFLLNQPPPPSDTTPWHEDTRLPLDIIHFLLRTIAEPLGALDVLEQLVYDVLSPNRGIYRLAVPEIDATFARACLLNLYRQLKTCRDRDPEKVQRVQEACLDAFVDLGSQEDHEAIEAGLLALRLIWPGFYPLDLISSTSPFWSLMIFVEAACCLRLLKLSAAIDFFIETKAHVVCEEPICDVYLFEPPRERRKPKVFSGRILKRHPWKFGWIFDFQQGKTHLELPMRQDLQSARETRQSELQESRHRAMCLSQSLLTQATHVAAGYVECVKAHLPRDLVALVAGFFYDGELQWSTRLPSDKTVQDIADVDIIMAISDSFLCKRDYE